MSAVDLQEQLSMLKRLAPTDVSKCMQCGRCSAACPAGEKMDLLPHRMVYELARGHVDVLLAAESPWKCLSCMACVARCPRGVAPGAIMEAVRLMHIRQQGGARLTPESLQNYPADMPQQALVAAFRKFRK